MPLNPRRTPRRYRLLGWLLLGWLAVLPARADIRDDDSQVGLPGSLRYAPLTTSAPESLQAAQRELQLAEGGSPGTTGGAHTRMATVLLQLHRYDQALGHAQKALRFYQEAGKPTASSWLLLGRVRFAQGDTGRARVSYVQALQQFGRLHDATAEAHTYEHLADLYASERNWGAALNNYQRAYGIWQRLGNLRSAAVTLHAIGRMHLEQHHFSRAVYYLRQSAEQATALHDSVGVAYALHSAGEAYATVVGNQEVALGYYTRALGQLPRHATPAELAATLYESLARGNVALGNADVAERYLAKAQPLVQRAGSKARLAQVFQRLSDLYRQRGEVAPALTALSRYVSLQDSAAAERRAEQVAELRTRYETEKKEREIQLLIKKREVQEANLRRQKLARNVLAVGTVLLLLTVVALHRGRKEQLRVNLLLERQNAAISRQKEELDRLNRTKDTLFSVISHDLRSPLSSLYSLLTLLSMGTLPPEKIAQHTDRLSRTLDTTLRLLDNMLNWAATQMQGAGPRTEYFRLDAIAEECLTLLLGDAERKNIMVLNHLREEHPVRADLNMTRLVLRNLLSNAIKFTPSGGTVTLSATRQGKWWQVAVRDTGVGIAPADYTKIFGEAGHHTTLGTAREKGTGLGLRLCKDFVERNGGQLTFESEEGRGSTFRFTVLAAEPSVAPAPDAVRGRSLGAGPGVAPSVAAE
ncbi:tetratricopeptide repeat protein [Hymenobacter sp. 15J16-1T3B]|uniref:tetratricopeptide repeat-containing sensor histidine kinase n=1 Tax=Hymenobacter sp. 15J16-1T3B TaxID=2886941 RepID=UPI001D12514B|nr:tetratricopeptide repeat protein [Hymenobacter sp. 15J16-1T3B]MCC3158187.1 tetratricopeptide repeat protein [Hymenobacter sp. 15J16-1T3B]